MSGDFTYVSRTRKSRKNKLHTPETPSITSLAARVESAQSALLASPVSSRCLSALHVDDTDLVAFKDLLQEVPPPERIVCLGLGSLVEGSAGGKRISEVQLALLLELIKIVKVHVHQMH